MFQALRQKNLEDLKASLEAGADPASQAKASGRSALMVAARERWLEGVDLLLEAGADPMAMWNGDGHGRSAIWEAARSGDPKIVERILKSCPWLSVKDNARWEGLMFAIMEHEENPELLRSFLEAGVDPAEKRGARSSLLAVARRESEAAYGMVRAWEEAKGIEKASMEASPARRSPKRAI